MTRQALIDYRGNRPQKEMAEMYGVTQQAWSQWETGETKPNVALMRQIEKDSGVSMEILFFDVFNKKKLLNEKPDEPGEAKAV